MCMFYLTRRYRMPWIYTTNYWYFKVKPFTTEKCFLVKCLFYDCTRPHLNCSEISWCYMNIWGYTLNEGKHQANTMVNEGGPLWISLGLCSVGSELYKTICTFKSMTSKLLLTWKLFGYVYYLFASLLFVVQVSTKFEVFTPTWLGTEGSSSP